MACSRACSLLAAFLLLKPVRYSWRASMLKVNSSTGFWRRITSILRRFAGGPILFSRCCCRTPLYFFSKSTSGKCALLTCEDRRWKSDVPTSSPPNTSQSTRLGDLTRSDLPSNPTTMLLRSSIFLAATASSAYALRDASPFLLLSTE